MNKHLKDGNPDGPYKSYYESGQLKAKVTYKDGKIDGPYESYYENGQLKEKVTFKDEKLDGLSVHYYETGSLVAKGNFHMGERCGEWIKDGKTVTYDPCPDCDREVIVCSLCSRDLYEDELEFFDDGGFQCPHCGFGARPLEGTPLNGPYERYYPQWGKRGGPRQLKEKGTHKDGLYDGLQVRYYETGQLESKVTYKDGNPDGPYESYYENGQLKSKENYKTAFLLHGPCENYYENGQLKEKVTCKDGKLDGLYVRYYETGSLAAKGNYHMHERCGEWIKDGKTVTYDPCPDCDDE